MSENISDVCIVESGRRNSVANVSQFLTSPAPKPTTTVADTNEKNPSILPGKISNQVQPLQGSSKSTQAKNSIDDDEIKRVFGTDGFDPYAMVNAPPPKPWHKWTLKDDFEIGKPIGRGGFGHVYMARTKVGKRIVALKIMHEEDIQMNNAEAIVNRETEIHSSLHHENIIKMYGFFQDIDKIVLVLEYAAGKDVFGDLNSQPNGRYEESKAATYIDQVSNGLQYLHSKGIMHRDIKPENLLFGYFGEIKIADFGYSVQTTGFKECRRTICGTHEYMAPEMINKNPYTEKIDIWCVGVLAYEFLTGNSPFAVQCRKEMDKRITGVHIPTLPFHVSYQGVNLIKKILCKEPTKRLSLEQIREHEWIRVYKSKEPKKLLPCFQQFEHLQPALIERYKDAGRILAQKKLQEKKKKEASSTTSA